MNEITRTTPRSLGWGLFNDDFDTLVDSLFRPVRNSAVERTRGLVPATDVIEREHEYVVRAELPGVKKEDIDITVQDGVLTINAESKIEHEEKADGRVIRQERRYGKYVRSMSLGGQIDQAQLKANYKDGVLELVLPKAEAVKPRKIDVHVN